MILSLRQRLKEFPKPLTSVRQLAARYMPREAISLRNLMKPLDLQLNQRVFSSDLASETVTGWCEVILRSDGHVRYRGHLHDSSAIPHHYNVFTVLKLKPGTELIAPHVGNLHGTLGFGSRRDEWDEEGDSQNVPELWDQIMLGVSGSYTKFSVNTGPMQIVEALAAAGLISSSLSNAQVLLL